MSALGEAAVATEAEVVPATPGGLRKESAWRRRDRRWGYVFVGPQLIGMALLALHYIEKPAQRRLRKLMNATN